MVTSLIMEHSWTFTFDVPTLEIDAAVYWEDLVAASGFAHILSESAALNQSRRFLRFSALHHLQ